LKALTAPQGRASGNSTVSAHHAHQNALSQPSIRDAERFGRPYAPDGGIDGAARQDKVHSIWPDTRVRGKGGPAHGE
jgi:hypothetical protein